MDSFLLNYSDTDIDVAVEFLTTWLPFLSRNLCLPCAATLRHTVASLSPQGSGDESAQGCACSTPEEESRDGGHRGFEGIQATGCGVDRLECDMEPDRPLGGENTPPPSGWETPEPTGGDADHAPVVIATGLGVELEVVQTGCIMDSEEAPVEVVEPMGLDTDQAGMPEATGWVMESERVSVSVVTPSGLEVESERVTMPEVVATGWEEPERVTTPEVVAIGWEMEPERVTTPEVVATGWETEPERVITPEVVATGWEVEPERVTTPEVVATGWEMEPERVSSPEVVANGWEMEPERVTAPEVVATGWEMEPERVTAPEVVATGWEMEPERVTTPEVVATGWEMEPERVTAPEVVATGWEMEPERVTTPEVVAIGWEMEPERVTTPEVALTGRGKEPENAVKLTDYHTDLDLVEGEGSRKVKMSWADMAEDELEGSPRSESSVEKKKTELSREKRELIRFRKVQRKMDYICLERVHGKIVNVLSGLELHTGVFSAAEQKRIVDFVYELQEKGRKRELGEHTYSKPKKWMRGKGRETIQFGCCYNYAKKDGNLPGILKNVQSDPLPSLFKVMIKRMVRWRVLPPDCVPDSCIVNIYEPEDCIPPHIDSHDFVRPFCTVSFLSECNILFGSELRIAGPGEFEGSFAIPLPVGSVLVLNGNGANVAKHCVPAVPTKRISITFRTMDERKRPKDFVLEPDLQNIIQLPYDSGKGAPLNDTGTSVSRGEQHVSEIKGNKSWGKQSMVNQGHDFHRSQQYSYDMETHSPSSFHRNVDLRTSLNMRSMDSGKGSVRRFPEPKPLDEGLLGSRPHQVTTDMLVERSAGQGSHDVRSARLDGSSEQRVRRTHLDPKQFMPRSRSVQGEDNFLMKEERNSNGYVGRSPAQVSQDIRSARLHSSSEQRGSKTPGSRSVQGEDYFLMNEERNSNGYVGRSPGQVSQDIRSARLHSSSEQRGSKTPGSRSVQGEDSLMNEERNSGRRGMLEQQRSVTSRNQARDDDPIRAGGYMPDRNRVNQVSVRSLDNNPRRGWASYSDR